MRSVLKFFIRIYYVPDQNIMVNKSHYLQTIFLVVLCVEIQKVYTLKMSEYFVVIAIWCGEKLSYNSDWTGEGGMNYYRLDNIH